MSASPASPAHSRTRVTVAVGAGQLLAWASSYYLLAILARPMAQSLAIAPALVYAAFSAALILGALLGPAIGGWMDRRGARPVLLASNGVFAAALLCLALAPNAAVLVFGWLLLGVAMPMGLYDAAFTLLVSLYRNEARRSIVGVTLIAGFSSSVSWPLSAAVEVHYGWRAVCAMWALLHLTVGVSIHALLLPDVPVIRLHADPAQPVQARAAPPLSLLWMLAAVFAASGFVFSAYATHLPEVLQAVGCTPAAAIAAAALIGVAQVGGRLAEVGFLHRVHPLVSARISMALHPIGVLLLILLGAPAAMLFTALHGAGIGLMTIVKGTLPLALFGSEGFGRRSALLEAPSRVAQAMAPLLFGVALDAWGSRVLWISGALAFAGFVGVLSLRRSAAQNAA